MGKNKVILVQPTMGISGEFVRHIPLSLLYVASGLVKNGFEVIILDNRVNPRSWREKLLHHLDKPVLFVGITVMSGSPIANAIEISRLIKSKGNIPLVWGGAHPTVAPRQILMKDFVDFTISGSGVGSSVSLASALIQNESSSNKLEDISGLGYKRDGIIHCNPPFGGFEHVPYRDIPYFLIKDFSSYGQIGSSGRIFPIFSSYGCVYNCAFCISPHLYHNLDQKWLTLDAEEVVDHIEYLNMRYGATEIYFYDEDSFIRLDHVCDIIGEIKKRKIRVRMSFRGARVNEVLKMDDDYLNNLADAGTHILHIGIESGSQRILDLFKKGIEVADIIEMNRRISKNRKIIAFYNWIIGTPTETLEDISMTMRLILQLIEENPRCSIFPPNKFRPIPGTELYELAVKFGYKEPADLEGWIYEETEGGKPQPWYSPKLERLIRLAQVTSYFIDNKPGVILEKSSLKNTLIKLIYSMYSPIARWRFKHYITSGFIEYPIYQLFVTRCRKLGR